MKPVTVFPLQNTLLLSGGLRTQPESPHGAPSADASPASDRKSVIPVPLGLQSHWGKFARSLFSLLLVLSWAPFACSQESPGSEDLDQAFDKKIKAQSTRDLEAVVKLCKSALEKGLDEEGTIQAKQLAASASMEHAEQLTKRIFDQNPPDPRWQKFRSEAIQQLEQATELDPGMVNAYLMIARLNTSLPNGNMEAARAAVEKAVDKSSDDPVQLSSALFYRASLSEDKEAQLADINQALEVNPNNLDALRFRAVYYLNQRDIDKGLADIQQWLNGENAKPDDFLATIVLLRAMGSSFDENLQEEAIKLINRGLEMAPGDPRFLEQRAEIHVLRKDIDAALQDLNKLLESPEGQKPPKAIGYHLLRGSLYSQQEKHDEALAEYDAVLKENPNALPAIEAKASTLAAKGDFAGSIKEFKKIQRRVGSDNPALMRQIGMLHNANEEPTKAVDIYNELLDLLAEENFSDRPEEVQRGIELERQATWRARGDAYLSLGKHKEAIEDYNKVLEIHQNLQEGAIQEDQDKVPDDEHVLNNLAWVLATSPVDELRDGKRAIELATKAAEASEYKEAYILSTLASAYAETGDFENATKWIQKAMEINQQERETNETARNLEQKESLQKEYDHYQKKEPFREMQNVEQEKAEKLKAEQEKSEKEKTEPGDSEKKDSENTDSEQAAPETTDGGYVAN
jgi:tetratricopeptide (TPR) repeat protein